MPRARWWVLAGLSLVTVTVVTLDATGVIFEREPIAIPPVPLQFDAPAVVDSALRPVNTFASVSLSSSVRRAVASSLQDKDLGPQVSATVVSSSGEVLFDVEADRPAIPASNLKLLTALSVLDAYPTPTRIETKVVEGGRPDELVLIGGGDATLTVDPARSGRPATASLSELARETRKVVGNTKVRLAYDDSLFSGPSAAPSWEPTYVSSGVIAPVTALMADQGLVSDTSLARYPDPAAAAADDFARLLEQRGIVVRGAPTPTTAATPSTLVAAVESPPIDLLIERMLRDSDNQLAEALGRLAALGQGFPASFDGAVAAIGLAAGAHGIAIDTEDIHDASGLSRDDLVKASALAEVLRTAVNEPELRPITTGLSVAGFDGTLIDRYLSRPQSEAAGIIRAKTGTLTGVSAESGMAVTCDGSLVLFTFVADRVPFDTVAARDALDEAAAALASCR